MKTKDTQILKQIKQAVLSVDANADLILFGSRARGENSAESDWDLLILSDNKINLSFKNKISDTLFFLGLENKTTVSPVIVNKEKWYKKFNNHPLFFEIKREGVAL